VSCIENKFEGGHWLSTKKRRIFKDLKFLGLIAVLQQFKNRIMASSLLYLVIGALAVLILDRTVDASGRSKHLIHVTEEKWRDILTGEWMLEFHAPWCPACKDLVKSWNGFAEWSKDLSVNVGEIDVTTNTGLSGRFLVTALPTIYHVKDGVFRAYSGPRDKDDLISFIEEKKWTIIEPMPSWKHPDSFQMSVVSWFFKASMTARDLHNYLTEKQGLPSWASYALFGLATLILGCILGFFIVCIIDWVFPATPSAAAIRRPAGAESKKQQKKDKKQHQRKAQEDAQKTKDDEDKLSDIDSSQASQHDSQQSMSEGEEEEEETVRQRKGDKKDTKPVANGNSSKEASPKKKK